MALPSRSKIFKIDGLGDRLFRYTSSGIHELTGSVYNKLVSGDADILEDYLDGWQNGMTVANAPIASQDETRSLFTSLSQRGTEGYQTTTVYDDSGVASSEPVINSLTSAPRKGVSMGERYPTGSTQTENNTINENYYLKPGETIDQYNLRIAQYNGGTQSNLDIGGQTGGAGGATGRTVGGSTGGTQGGTQGRTPANIQRTGNPAFDAMLEGFQKMLDELEAKGQIINPNIVLSPETVARFLKEAESEINPYYSTQLKSARESLLYNAGYAKSEVLRNEQELERQYQTQFRQVGESAADRGFALSGMRQRDEGGLATETQNTINSNRRTLDLNLGNTAREYAQTYGTSVLPSLNIGGAPSITGGEKNFTSGTGTRSLYTLDPDIYDNLVGSQEFGRRGAVASRSSQLEEAFRSDEAIKQQRSLIL